MTGPCSPRRELQEGWQTVAYELEQKTEGKTQKLGPHCYKFLLCGPTFLLNLHLGKSTVLHCFQFSISIKEKSEPRASLNDN